MTNTPFPTSRFASKAALWRRFHRASAVLLGCFVLLHLANHVAGFAGQAVHRQVQLVLRMVYQGWLEPLLLAACLIQVATGLRLVWQRRGTWLRQGAQPVSGLYLAIFLGIHVTAVLQARWVGVETDLAFAAAGMHAGAWKYFFAPYYGLAVLAFGWHIAVPVGRRNATVGRAVQGAAAVLAAALVALLAGWITPLSIDPALIRAFPH